MENIETVTISLEKYENMKNQITSLEAQVKQKQIIVKSRSSQVGLAYLVGVAIILYFMYTSLING